MQLLTAILFLAVPQSQSSGASMQVAPIPPPAQPATSLSDDATFDRAMQQAAEETDRELAPRLALLYPTPLEIASITPSAPSSMPASAPSTPDVFNGCASGDVHCFKVKWIVSDLHLAIANNDLAAAQRSVISLTADLAATRSLINSAVAGIQSAATTTNNLADKVGIPWYFHPALWVTVGAVVATSLVIGFERLAGIIH